MRSSLQGIDEFGKAVRTQAVKALLKNPRNGLFVDSCRHHTKCWSSIVIDGYTPAQVIVVVSTPRLHDRDKARCHTAYIASGAAVMCDT